MDASTSRRQLRLGAALTAVTFLPFTMSAALAEPSTLGVTAISSELSEQHVTEIQQQEVPYGDLDLEKAKGLETLNNRIAAAVRNVCMHSDPREEFRMFRLWPSQRVTRACPEFQGVREWAPGPGGVHKTF